MKLINLLKELVTNMEIICDNCGWRWKIKDGGDDLYICYKCGHDNNPEKLQEEKEKRDRCLRIADRKFDKPSAYKSGAVVRCRKGDIWKGLKEENISNQSAIQKIDQLPQGKLFNDAKNIEGVFKKSSHSWSKVIELFEKNKNKSKLEVIDTKDIHITQPNIQANKVKNMLDKVNNLLPINVVEFEDGEKVIYDAHHRLVANWALGNDKIKVNLVKINNLKEDISTINYKNIKETNDPQSGKAAPYGSGYSKVNELRQGLLKKLKQQLPNFPDYVIKDWIYKMIKKDDNINTAEGIQDWIDTHYING
jgi:hypothetical protein